MLLNLKTQLSSQFLKCASILKFMLKFSLNVFFCVFAWIYDVYACMPAARGGHRRTLDPLGLELGSCESAWVLRKRSSNAPKHWVTFTILHKYSHTKYFFWLGSRQQLTIWAGEICKYPPSKRYFKKYTRWTCRIVQHCL